MSGCGRSRERAIACSRKKARFPILLAFFIAILRAQGFSQAASEDPDALYARAKAAIDEENYEKAVRLLEVAKKLLPRSPEFPILLGDLYSEKKLYPLALEEYRVAEKSAPANSELLSKMATTLGRLNREPESIGYLEKTLALDPDNLDAIGDLGWMCFKVHQLAKGEKVLLDAAAKHGMDRSFAMTLGTIYSEMYDYGNAKEFYDKSIHDPDTEVSRSFTSVAYYNLSLLEEKFHRYDEALETSERSIASFDRASGHLSRGDLYLKRADFPKTFIEYEMAFSLDVSPLSSINLADAAIKGGKLSEARRYIESVMNTKDNAWMMNFGTDLKNHAKDIREISTELYEGLAEKERRRPKSSILDSAKGFFSSQYYRLLAWQSRQYFRKYSLEIGKSLDKEGNYLSAQINYYNAFEGYPGIALKYLERARDFEADIIPEARPSYDVEEAILKGDPDEIEGAAARLDPVWERLSQAEALAESAKIRLKRGEKEKARTLLEKLYGLNRGAFVRNGLGLPVELEIRADTPAEARKLRQRLPGMLRTSGMELANEKNAPAFSYTLSVSTKAGRAEIILGRESGAGPKEILKKNVEVESYSRKGIASLAASLIDSIYSVD